MRKYRNSSKNVTMNICNNLNVTSENAEVYMGINTYFVILSCVLMTIDGIWIGE
jgi:hypothetical protein